MQAIETKYLGPTNTRGSRIKATCEAGSITIPYGNGNTEECHIEAAKALCNKLTFRNVHNYKSVWKDDVWQRPFVTGGLKNSYVHVFTY